MKQHQGVRRVAVDEGGAGQRLDNFLLRHLKGVPRGVIYKAVRTGQVRVNGRRAKSMQKLQVGDEVRIPPVQARADDEAMPLSTGHQGRLEAAIIHEDEDLLVVNKPSGLAVHGGSGIRQGLIEQFRLLRPQCRYLELAHRLDRDTSGVLVMAKKRSALMKLHEAFRDRQTEKIYEAWVVGCWPAHVKEVTAPLRKNVLRSGERVVRVDAEGKPSLTRFRVLRQAGGVALVEVRPVTGRTHQIRVHAQFAGCPIVGDDKYGRDEDNRFWAARGLGRLCLHARRLRFPWRGRHLAFEAPWELHDWSHEEGDSDA
ncbi:MAG: RluA family pseudouridine synthase [Gammaproteobacteria bacterium]|nr:MAG: RluA family pseudouridine synthase [Gammaproteobacteria bacterium]